MKTKFTEAHRTTGGNQRRIRNPVKQRAGNETTRSSPPPLDHSLDAVLVGRWLAIWSRGGVAVSGALLKNTEQNQRSNKMKTNRNPKLLRSLAAVVGGFALFTGAGQAAPFLYTSGDLTLTFRKSGNAFDYVVNIGKATNYNNVPTGTTFVVTNLSVGQLSAAFPSYNDLKWSVAAANRLEALDPNYPLQTLWISRQRISLSEPSTPWQRRGTSLQGNNGSQIDAIGKNAALASSTLPGGANNTATGVVIPVGNNPNVGSAIGVNGNYAGNFQGNVETLTAGDFADDSANVSLADLYELLPGTGDARYLGYFQLRPNGTLTFNNPATAPAAPTITSIVRNGQVTTVSFTTVNGATYRLRSTNAAGLTTPVSSWLVSNNFVTGTGAVLSLTDTTAADIQFYAVQAQ
jgi:hypothetical protein